MPSNTEQVCVIDTEKGPLIVTTDAGAARVRLAVSRGTKPLVYVTYARTDERDADGRPIYRE